MELMIDVVERADGDGDFFEIFSKVLTKYSSEEKNKRKRNEIIVGNA